MIDTYLQPWKNYATFSGRASRSEFWTFVLANAAIVIVLEILASQLKFLFALVILFALAYIIPTIAVSVRRMHDRNSSGWMILLGLIPFIGGIILLILYCSASTPGSNQYGPNPHGAVAYA